MTSVTVPLSNGKRYHEVVLIPAELADRVWIIVRPFVNKALRFAHGEVDEHTLLARIAQGAMQLWVVFDTDTRAVRGVATTSIMQYDKLTSLRIVTMGGQEFDSWGEDLHEALMTFAAREGCSRLEAAGRKGLGRLLSRFGFEEQYVTFKKEVQA